MAKEKKTLKFQMMMSPQEAEVLDDWMFKNRVRSRAEAIRRLCQVGLSTAANWRSLRTAIDDAVETNHLAVRVLEEDFYLKASDRLSDEQGRRYANTITDAYEKIGELSEQSRDFHGEVAPFLNTGVTVAEAKRKSEEQRELILAKIQKRRLLEGKAE